MWDVVENVLVFNVGTESQCGGMLVFLNQDWLVSKRIPARTTCYIVECNFSRKIVQVQTLHATNCGMRLLKENIPGQNAALQSIPSSLRGRGGETNVSLYERIWNATSQDKHSCRDAASCIAMVREDNVFQAKATQPIAKFHVGKKYSEPRHIVECYI